VAHLDEAMFYKPEIRGFDSRYWNFSLTLSFQPHYGPGLTQPVPEVNTGKNSWRVKSAGA
jgi:hypothetical protein